jgi:predicted 3-demethylubiquinone-9 3-methyltransferase (glyoxalase superfamily)
MAVFQNYPRVTPFLWFQSKAEEAVAFYISIFPHSQLLAENFPADFGSGGGEGAKPLTIAFTLDGQPMTAINGGPPFTFNEAVSLVVRCDTQSEVDHYYNKLSEGGQEIQCGWIKDRYGLVWQIVPGHLPEIIKNPKAMAALMKMKKIDIAELEKAAEG